LEEDELVALLARSGFEAIEIRKSLVAENDFGSTEVLFVAAQKKGTGADACLARY
jgi:hypothetical protein